MNILDMLTDVHKTILIQIYYNKDESVYLGSGEMRIYGRVINLWGGCNSDSDCKCYGGCSRHKGAHLGNYDPSRKSTCYCKGDKFLGYSDDVKPDDFYQMVIDCLTDLVHMDLIEQYKGWIYLTEYGKKLLYLNNEK